MTPQKVSSYFDLNDCSAVERYTDPELEQYDVEVYIRRDDQIHPVISGNKWRKLKYPLMEAAESGKQHILTFGGAYSNHLPAVAIAAKELGFRSTGIVRGDELNPLSNPVLQFCSEAGMELIFSARDEFGRRTEYINKYIDKPENYFILDLGGYSAAGARGCEDMVYKTEMEFDHVFVPVGTGTTLAGVVNALSNRELKTVAHGIVVLKGAEAIANDIDALLYTNGKYILHHEYHFGGFGKSDKVLDEFCAMKGEVTGVSFEPVYSGKMVYGFYEQVRSGQVKGRVLLVHTGGLFTGR